MRARDRTLGRRTSADSEHRPIVLLPIGSCEQHGPHLPLATDTIIAEALAISAAGRTPDAAVAPALGVTASGEHEGFAGTLSIGTVETARVIVELVRSADWASGVVLVNGHGGNRDAVRGAVTTLTAERRAVLAWWPHVAGGDAHAGRTETSLLLALDPDSVRLELAEPGVVAPLREIAGRLHRDGVRAVSPNGVLGDPSGASASEGRRIFDALVDDLTTAIARWRAT